MVSLTSCIIVLIAAAFAPLVTKLVGVDPYTFNQRRRTSSATPAACRLGQWGGISLDHPLGVEPQTGRDIFARLLYGARISLLIALSATVHHDGPRRDRSASSPATRKGAIDTVLGRLMDLILAFPLLLILLALSPVLTQRLEQTFHVAPATSARVTYIILVLSLFGWPYLARIVRGQVLSLREREFVEAAVAMGAGTPRILFKEILPNLWAPILVYTSLIIPTYIAAEATLSFLGVGLLPPTPSWGAMLADSVTYFYTVDPRYLFIPGTPCSSSCLAFNLLGDCGPRRPRPRAGRR